MQSWMGLSLFDAFDGWRFSVGMAQRQRRREERQKLKEDRLQFEDAVARYEYYKIEISLWEKGFDEFNDLPCWVHPTTNDILYDEPVLPPYPTIPSFLLDPETGERLNQKQILENEADSEIEISSDSSFGSTKSAASGESGTGSRQQLLDSPPKGKTSELELAKQRVLERQRTQVKNKYNI